MNYLVDEKTTRKQRVVLILLVFITVIALFFVDSAFFERVAKLQAEDARIWRQFIGCLERGLWLAYFIWYARTPFGPKEFQQIQGVVEGQAA